MAASGSATQMVRDSEIINSAEVYDDQREEKKQVEDTNTVSIRSGPTSQRSTPKVTSILEWKGAAGTLITGTSESGVSGSSQTQEKLTIGGSTSRGNLAETTSEPMDVFRSYFGRQILADIVQLQKHTGEPTAAIYADSILKNIRRFRDRAPLEPFLEVLMALHDAMAFENRWIRYDATQYEGALKLLKSYVNQKLDNSKSSKAIVKLSQLGFETIPFGVTFESEDES